MVHEGLSMPANFHPGSAFWLAAAGAICLAVCLGATTVGTRLNVMDHPNADRKRHAAPTPQVGGIAIMLALSVWAGAALILGEPAGEKAVLLTLLLCGGGVGLLGFADDQSLTSPLVRLLSLAVFLGLVFTVLPELIAPAINWGGFAPTLIPAWAFGLLASVAVIGLVNAVNMADGQNGIVASMFVVWSVCLMLVGDALIGAIASVLLISSFIVLGFNLRGKLFLGDCGSYGSTFAFALLAILAHARGEASAETIVVWFFVPVIDCVRLIIARMRQGRSPADGDRDHLHHHLQDKGGKTFTLILYIGVVGLTSLAASLAPQYDLFYLAGLFVLYLGFIRLTSTKAEDDADVGARSMRVSSARATAFGTVMALTSGAAASDMLPADPVDVHPAPDVARLAADRSV